MSIIMEAIFMFLTLPLIPPRCQTRSVSKQSFPTESSYKSYIVISKDVCNFCKNFTG